MQKSCLFPARFDEQWCKKCKYRCSVVLLRHSCCDEGWKWRANQAVVVIRLNVIFSGFYPVKFGWLDQVRDKKKITTNAELPILAERHSLLRYLRKCLNIHLWVNIVNHAVIPGHKFYCHGITKTHKSSPSLETDDVSKSSLWDNKELCAVSRYPTDELFGGLSNLSLLSKFHVYSVFATVHLSSHLALSTQSYWEAA